MSEVSVNNNIIFVWLKKYWEEKSQTYYYKPTLKCFFFSKRIQIVIKVCPFLFLCYKKLFLVKLKPCVPWLLILINQIRQKSDCEPEQLNKKLI